MKKIACLLLMITFVSLVSSCKADIHPIKESGTNGILYPIYKNGKYGYIDSNGEIKIKPQFDDAQDFYEGLAVVYVNGLAGYINRNGEFILDPQYDYAGGFYNGIADYGVSRGEDPYKPFNYIIGYINTEGKILKEPIYKFIRGFSESLAQVTTNERYGYIDTEFNMVIEEKFVSSGDFHEGLAFARVNNLEPYGYIDSSGEFVIEPIFYSAGNFQNGYAPVMYRKEELQELFWGYINKEGEFAIKPKYYGAVEYSEGLFGVGIKCEDGITRFGYIDIDENIIIEPIFEEVEPFSEGLAAVKLPDPKNPEQSKYQQKWRFGNSTAI